MRPFLGLLVTAGVIVAALPPERPEFEVARLRRHFATVLAELESRDVSSLSPTQRVARARHIERLRQYAQRGVFPKNTDFAGQAVPYFIDRDGTLCAMAYLIEQSGQGDYVRAVAEKINNAFVAEIARDEGLGPPLTAWLTENGLTLEEAARIQPTYCEFFRAQQDRNYYQERYYQDNCVMQTGEVVVRVAAGTSALGLTAINLIGAFGGSSRRTTGWAGIAVGVLGVGMAYTYIHRPGDSGDKPGQHELAYMNGIFGSLSILSGMLALATLGSQPAAPENGPQAMQLRAAPWLEPDRAGFTVHVRF